MTAMTPARIVTEAEKLFAEQGFAGTSLARIATAVGLGNAGVLHHFPSKAAIYRAVLVSIADDLASRTHLGDEADPVERLDQIVAGLLALQADRPASLAIIAHEFLDQTGRIEDADVLPLAGVARDTVAALEDGQRDGSIRQGDPIAMAAALHGALLIGGLGRTIYSKAVDADTPSDWESELARSALASVVMVP